MEGGQAEDLSSKSKSRVEKRKGVVDDYDSTRLCVRLQGGGIETPQGAKSRQR